MHSNAQKNPLIFVVLIDILGETIRINGII